MPRLLLTALLFAVALVAQISEKTFRHHYIARDLPGGQRSGHGTPALADFDGDGDLDFTVCSRHGWIYWFENQGQGKWRRHELGQLVQGQLGAAVLDVDRDGHADLIIGGYWYRNPGNPREQPFARYRYDSRIQREIHDLITADIDGDGRADAVALGDKDGLFWYSVPAEPTRGADWPRRTVTLDVLDENDDIHSGIYPQGAGDLDGDGDLDLMVTDRWYENQQGGTRWVRHRLLFGSRGPWGLSSRSWIVDLDGDGDNDIIATHSDQQNSAAAWLENNGETPPRFRAHYMANQAPGTRGSMHSLAVADFDLDGDLDVVTVEQEDTSIPPLGAPGPRWYVFENAGSKSEPRFEERVIFDGRLGGHDIQAGDVDGDGDADIVSKIWRRWPGNANGGEFHADFFENRTR